MKSTNSDSLRLVLISLHADPVDPPGVGTGGGTHLYLRELMCGLARRQVPYLLITRHSQLDLPKREQVSSRATLIRIGVGPKGSLDKRELNNHHEETVKKIQQSLRELDIRPMLFHSIYWNSGRAALELSHLLGVEYVHTVISNGARRRLQGAVDQPEEREEVEAQVFDQASTIFAVSTEEREDLVKLYDVDETKIVVVGRPVDFVYKHPVHDRLGLPRPLPELSELIQAQRGESHE